MTIYTLQMILGFLSLGLVIFALIKGNLWLCLAGQLLAAGVLIGNMCLWLNG